MILNNIDSRVEYRKKIYPNNSTKYYGDFPLQLDQEHWRMLIIFRVTENFEEYANLTSFE